MKITSVPFLPFISSKHIFLLKFVTHNKKYGAFVPNGSMFEGVTDIFGLWFLVDSLWLYGKIDKRLQEILIFE